MQGLHAQSAMTNVQGLCVALWYSILADIASVHTPCRTPAAPAPVSEWDSVEATPAVGSRWDATPGAGLAAPTPSRRNRWDDATPRLVGAK